MAFLAFLAAGAVWTDCLVMYAVPSRWAIMSAITRGKPFSFGSLPYGVVDVFMPMRVVGAIWPPVMP